MLFRESILLERNMGSDPLTVNFGMQALKVPVPILNCRPINCFITIDKEKPTLQAIENYRKRVGRSDELVYGDFKMFVHEITHYAFDIPVLEEGRVLFGKTVEEVDMINKQIVCSEGGIFSYDILISTIPLITILKLVNFSKDALFADGVGMFLMHRPIYVQVEKEETDEPQVLRADYISDEDNPFYRVTHFNGLIQRESLFHVSNSHKLFPGKVYGNKFVASALDDLKHYGIFCFGRYGIWSPSEHIHQSYRRLVEFKQSLGL